MPRVRNLKGAGLTPDTLPAGSVYIGNRWLAGRVQWPQTVWGNRFGKRHGTPAERVRLFECDLCTRPDMLARLPELHGMDLWCWCSPADCHGDVLLRLAAGAASEAA